MAKSGSSAASGRYSGSLAGKDSYGLGVMYDIGKTGYGKGFVMDYSKGFRNSHADYSSGSGVRKAYEVKDISSMIQSFFRDRKVYDARQVTVSPDELEERIKEIRRKCSACGFYNN